MAAVFIRMFQHSQELALVVIVFRKQQEEHSRKQHELCSCRDNTASVPLRVLVRAQNGEAGLSLEAAQWARLTVVEPAQWAGLERLSSQLQALSSTQKGPNEKKTCNTESFRSWLRELR